MTVIDNGIALPGLCVAPTSYVVDPVLANVVETEYSRVTCANPTSDPNRMTIHVPTDHTVLSIGAASSRWHTDLGIVGYADHHVHFETKTQDMTVVSLGEPATTSSITGHGGDAPVSTQGYSMVTSQLAWHQARGQHYLLSQEQDISLRTMGSGKRVVVQADDGYVDLNGGKEVSLKGEAVAIGGASSIATPDVTYGAPWTGQSVSSATAKYAKLAASGISALMSAHDLGLKAFKTGKKALEKKLKVTDFLFADVIKWIGDAIKFGLSIDKIIGVFTHASSPPGCVKLGAEKDIVGLAGSDIALCGFKGASLGSIGSTAVGASVMASLKGVAFAGVGSVLTSVKAVKKMEVSSSWGDVVFSAKKNVEFTADTELVCGGEDLVQVVGEDSVLCGAGKRAWLGTEAGGGWGMLMDDKGIAFGKATSADKMKSAGIADSPAIRIDSGKIDIHGAAGAITLSDDLCLVEAPKILLEAKKKSITFNGAIAVTMK